MFELLLLKKFRQRTGSQLLSVPPISIDLNFITLVISNDDSSSLLEEVTNDEYKETFFSMNPHKAPGPDGFGTNFFQTYWHIVGNDLSLAIKSLFFHWKLPPPLNHTIITVIPKQDLIETKHRTIYAELSFWNPSTKLSQSPSQPLKPPYTKA